MSTILMSEFANPNPPYNGLVQAMTDAMTSDNIEGIVSLFAPDGEWTIMPTGETFRGLDHIRRLATRSVAGRKHPAGEGIKPRSIFTNAEGTKLCWEYVHSCEVTDKWPSSTNTPSPGTRVKLPVVLICEIRDDKFVRIREYFDLLTATEPGAPRRLYS
jgi:ketosteroid isomerase-like protein